MRDDHYRFLALASAVPGRLTAEQTAWLIGCQPHDVPVLVASRLLKPLGSPAANASKYFAAVDILELARDRAWLSKATSTLSAHWRTKNAQKRATMRVDGETSEAA